MEKKIVKKTIKKKIKKTAENKVDKIAKNNTKSLFSGFYGKFLILFFLLSGIYLSWTYIVPIYLSNKYPQEVVCKNLGSKIGFDIKCDNLTYYTTPSLNIGMEFSNSILYYPSSKIKKDEFMKIRKSTFEIPLIPLLMKTIKFNKFDLKSTIVNLYQNEQGDYVFIQNIQSNFNPQMPKYELKVPKIKLIGYAFKNFNAQTQEYKVLSGKEKNIPISATKDVLNNANNKTIILR